MKQWKRLLYYLMINVLVSACTVLVVLNLWGRGRAPAATGPAEGPAAAAPGEMEETGEEIESTASVPQTSMAQMFVTATLTPTGDPLPPVIEYEIKANDTLGQISERFDISLEEILAVNEALEDPDTLEVGQIIYIPATPGPGLLATPQATSTPAALETTAGGEATPAVPGEAPRVVIRNVFGVGDLTTERVFLQRLGDGELDLTGWKLRDENGQEFTFPALRMFADGAVHVWTTSGSQTVVDLYWGQTSSVWSVGETVTLMDAAGNSHATYVIP